jgi:hypothetical protein
LAGARLRFAVVLLLVAMTTPRTGVQSMHACSYAPTEYRLRINQPPPHDQARMYLKTLRETCGEPTSDSSRCFY